jgi:hypothetical protein
MIILQKHVLSQEFDSPVRQFTTRRLEPVLDAKDDNGFAPLRVRLEHVKNPLWNLKFSTYHHQLQNLFAYELQGHKTMMGIHFPPIIRSYQPTIKVFRHHLMVSLANDSLTTIAHLGFINLRKHGWDHLDGVKFIIDFLNRYTDYDHIYFSLNVKKEFSIKDIKKDINHAYWNNIDDYIFDQVFKIKNIRKTSAELNEEIVRRIGEFFKWRTNVINFVDKMPAMMKEISNLIKENPEIIKNIPEEVLLSPSFLFKLYLKKTDKDMKQKDIEKYGNYMDLKNYFFALSMNPVDPNNEEQLSMIFDKFLEKKLFDTQEEKNSI